jgi:hypothetical protein
VACLVTLLLLGRGQALGREPALEVTESLFFDELRKEEEDIMGRSGGKGQPGRRRRQRWKGRRVDADAPAPGDALGSLAVEENTKEREKVRSAIGDTNGGEADRALETDLDLELDLPELLFLLPQLLLLDSVALIGGK